MSQPHQPAPIGRDEQKATAPIRVVAYARLSPRPDDGFGLDVQAEQMRAYATLYGLELIEVKTEPKNISGKSLDRPALQEALALLDGGLAAGLLVAKLDRLSRSVVDMGYLIEAYFEKRFSLFSVGEQINTRTASGRMVVNLLALVGQWERETISERTSQALQHLKVQGVQLGRPGLGLEHAEEEDEDGRKILRAVASEVETVERIVQFRHLGYSLRDIATLLSFEGRKTKRGGDWHASTVSKILRRVGRQRSDGA